MGAGNGELTRYLAPHASFLMAVEPNARFAGNLNSLVPGDNYLYQQCNAEDFVWESQQFDLILLAYVLESMGGRDKWATTCENLLSLLSRKGKLVGATYVDGCAWDSYATVVEEEIGLDGRSGGLSRVFPDLRSRGFNVRILKIVTTQIWADNHDELYDGLSFFFRRKADLYAERKNLLVSSLRSVSSNFGQEVCVEVEEAIYEIFRLPDHLI